MAEEQPVSERSEFGLRAASDEEHRAPTRLYRVGSRPAKGPFGSFWVHPKGTRARSGRKLCTCLRFVARRFATLMFCRKRRPTAGAKIKYRASALSRGLLLSWQK